MCEDCKSNGPQSIVGIPVAYYAERLLKKERFRLRLCYEIQVQILWGLWKHNKTPDDKVSLDHTLSMQLWRECDLNFDYGKDLAKALRVRSMEKAKTLLEADSWGAFQSVGKGKDRRLI
ncbi:hypothetical protein NW762_012890 [Fusarium torreyae]|uniref:Uncharacterized protein n=1 Tax=Fusarium torreyae TaxID=1237075 RepID=A0A9W8RPM8_9HYPO|nr:hypothetical protein NW762_012890 [Fusarium torreyae]